MLKVSQLEASKNAYVFPSSSIRLLNSYTEQTKTDVADMYGILKSSAREGSLDGEAGVGVLMTGQGRCTQGYGQGHIIFAGHAEAPLLSPKTAKDHGYSFKRDEVDSSAWNSKAGSQDLSKDYSASRDDTDGGKSGALSTQARYSEEEARSSGDDKMEAGLISGGGAFTLFRRDSAKKPSTAVQSTVVQY